MALVHGLVSRAEQGAAVASAGLADFALGHRRLLGALLLALFAAAIALSGILYPEAEWDLVAYVATILEGAVSNPQALHAETWARVRDAVSPGEFLVLTGDRPYRVAQYADPAAFYSMLGFYRVKWLYIETISLVSQFAAPVDAIRLVSALSAAGIGLLVMGWLALADRLEWAPLALAALAIAGLGHIARIASPDAFASLFFLGAILAYLRGREVLVGAMLVCAFLARPDHLAFIAVFAVVAWWLRVASLGALAALVVSAGAYPLLTGAAGHPGWWVQFWFTNIEYVPTIEDFAPPFSLLVYLEGFVRELVRAVVSETWPGLLLACLCAWAAMGTYGIAIAGRSRAVLVALVLTLAAKFVVMPLGETRFHFAYVVAMALILVTSLPAVRLLPDGNGARGRDAVA